MCTDVNSTLRFWLYQFLTIKCARVPLPSWTMFPLHVLTVLGVGFSGFGLTELWSETPGGVCRASQTSVRP